MPTLKTKTEWQIGIVHRGKALTPHPPLKERNNQEKLIRICHSGLLIISNKTLKKEK